MRKWIRVWSISYCASCTWRWGWEIVQGYCLRFIMTFHLKVCVNNVQYAFSVICRTGVRFLTASFATYLAAMQLLAGNLVSCFQDAFKKRGPVRFCEVHERLFITAVENMSWAPLLTTFALFLLTKLYVPSFLFFFLETERNQCQSPLVSEKWIVSVQI